MILSNLFLAAIVLLVVGTLIFAAVSAVRTYLMNRGPRIVTCPETKSSAAVRMNAARAARDAVFGKAQLHLEQCSQWPERKNCGQECLAEIQMDPAECLVRNMVKEWYRGKSCAYCQRPFGEIHWHDRKPALLAPDRSSMQWNEVAAQKLPEVFATHLPICWNCHSAETSRRRHPEMVTERRWERNASGRMCPRMCRCCQCPNKRREIKALARLLWRTQWQNSQARPTVPRLSNSTCGVK
jgi:hypothetical protein